MKDLGGQVFSFFAARHTARDKCVDPVEIGLIKRSKAGRVTLSGLDQKPLVGVVLGGFQISLQYDQAPVRVSYSGNDAKRPKGYGLRVENFRAQIAAAYVSATDCYP